MEHQESQHKRRVRYSGTHPKNYKEKYKEHDPEKYADTIEKVIRKGSTPAGMHLSIMVKEILEFLQIKPDTHVFESDLEQALIDHLQQFLLELGRGFSFVARQKRFSLDGQNFYIDLVFYNYILKCFVLIDLKMGQLAHQDIGQMQMYVNYYTRELMNEGDNPPIGIVLCADKSDAIVKYTLPENNNQIFASKYFTYLPTEDELKRELQLDDFQRIE